MYFLNILFWGFTYCIEQWWPQSQIGSLLGGWGSPTRPRFIQASSLRACTLCCMCSSPKIPAGPGLFSYQAGWWFHAEETSLGSE